MDTFSVVATIVVICFVLFLIFRNRKSAQKEINNLNEIDFKSQSDVTFENIAGNYEAKESLKELVDFIKNPQKYEKFNIKTPKGVLLYGTPGTGKTLMAKALANEAGVDFFAVSGSDFVQVYAGLGAGRIRNLFNKAKKAKKSVVFIDEIDAIGKKRLSRNIGGSDEGDRTLNALLTEMSGFENSGTIVVAATNRLDTLDEALLRPGRFDRQLEIALPDKEARKDILSLYLNKLNCDEDIELDKLAEMTVYFSGAMIENLTNEAAITALRENSETVSFYHLEKAYFSVVAGADKQNKHINEELKKISAYHEAGHAFVSKYLMPENKIVRVSVIPTTKGAGGYTLSTPENETVVSKQKIENQLKVFLAGRASEEIFLGNKNVTVGAGNDIERATSLALDYVTKYGMCEDVGLLSYSILKKELDTNFDIEKSIKNLVDKSYEEALQIINENKKHVKSIAKMLIEKETINGEDISLVVGSDIVRKVANQ